MNKIISIFIIGLSFSQSTFNSLDFSSNAVSHSLHNGAIASKSQYLSINPASITIANNQIEFNQLILPADIKQLGFSFSFIYKKHIFFSKVNSTNYGTLKDDYENIKFKANDFIIELGHKFEYNNLFSIGYSIGYIKSKIYTSQASGIYSNIGVRMNLINNRFSFGSTLNHAGFQINPFEKNIESIPTTVRNGISYKPMYLPVNIYIDFINYRKNKNNKIQFGLDFKIRNKFNFRMSTVNNRKDLKTDQYYKDTLNNISFGLGIKIKNRYFNISVQNIGPAGMIYGLSIFI